MVVRTLSFVQKGQTRGRIGCSMQWISGIWWWGHCLRCKKVTPVDTVDAVTQWTQYTVDAVDAVCSGRSRINVYGCGDIVFDTKRSNQRMQWMQYAVE